MSCDAANTGCLNCTYDYSQKSLPYNETFYTCFECNNTLNYFLSDKLCVKCTLSNCLTCESLAKCAVCENTYDYSDAQTCIKCLVTGCINCSSTNASECTTCNNAQGYYRNAGTKQCDTQCGDGIVVAATEACDDGNLVDYDGCSSTCTIESSFTC